MKATRHQILILLMIIVLSLQTSSKSLYFGAMVVNTTFNAPLRIFPNPDNRTFRIDFQGLENQLLTNPEVNDAVGRIAYSTTDQSTLKNEIKFINIKPGIYRVRHTANKDYFIRKLIVTN